MDWDITVDLLPSRDIPGDSSDMCLYPEMLNRVTCQANPLLKVNKCDAKKKLVKTDLVRGIINQLLNMN